MEANQNVTGNEIQLNRIIYFDFLRIIAMIAVIILHVAANNWYTTDIHSFSWNVFNFYDGVVRWAVPVFTMISGALFLDNSRELSLKTLYTKKVFRIVIAFLFWSTAYAIIFSNNLPIYIILAKIISGSYHMWFLFMIVGLYIITPLLRRVTESHKDTQYFLLISFIFTFLIPAILLVIKVIDSLLNTGGALYDFANGVYGNVNFHFAVGDSFYYVLGYYISTTKLKERTERGIYILGIVGFISTVLLTKGVSCYLGSPNGTFYGRATINVMLESLAVFTFAKYRVAKWIKTEQQHHVIKTLSKYSFGIYLAHVGFINALTKLGLTTLSFNPIFSVIVIVSVVFLFSFTTSAILNKIPFINKYIV